MKTTQIDEQMKQAEERSWRRDFEQFRQQQLALFKRERAQQQKQRDIEASSTEMPRQVVESPT
jgi:hypothetical protein